MSAVRVVALVSGDVQGARSSASLQGPAPSLRGVGGSGVLTGRVEVVLEGPGPAVRDVVAALGGPSAPGRVHRVDAEERPAEGITGFRIL